MPNQIEKILKDIYALDPQLKTYEKQLRQIIAKIIAARPDTKFDKNFALKLRAELLKKIKETSPEKNLNVFNQIIELFTMKKLAYVAGGVVLTVLILIPVLSRINKLSPALPASLQVTKLKNQAFGSLSFQGQEQAGTRNELGAYKANTSLDASVGEEAQGFGGGVSGKSVTTVSAPAVMGTMPSQYSVGFQYKYVGESIQITDTQMAVFKRIKGEAGSSQLNTLVRQFDLGLADLASFGSGRLQLFSFTQDQSYGYNFTVDVENGTVAIYQNWNTWPLAKCQNEKCLLSYQVKPADVPADANLIKIADNFLNQHKISKATYGQPYVDNNWRSSLQKGEPAPDSISAPDSLSVVYPLVIDGKKVYEGGGYPVGLSITVSIKEKRVTGVNNLTTQKYDSSLYDAETDSEKILELAKTGGIYGYSYPEAGTIYTVELGQPEMALFRHWNYTNGQSEELLIPALVFPVTKEPAEAQSYRQNIIVPLIKDFQQTSSDNPIRILPTSGIEIAPAPVK